MVFTSGDRILIKAFRIEKGYGVKRLLKEFPTKPWSLTAVKKLLVKIDTTGSVSRQVGSGRPLSACTNDSCAIVADLVRVNRTTQECRERFVKLKRDQHSQIVCSSHHS